MSKKDPIDHLLSLGVECAGGRLSYRHQEVGEIKNGVLNLTPYGEKLMSVEDAVIVEKATPVEQPAVVNRASTRKGTTKANAQQAEPAKQEEPAKQDEPLADTSDLDAILGQ